MARISELHYSDAYSKKSGVAEFLEVALKPGEDPSDFAVGFYHHNGKSGVQISLDDPGVEVTFDSDANEYVYVISNENFGILLTDPNGKGAHNYEAFALANTTKGEVLDFYDIGGGAQKIKAKGGVADGATSENIAVPTNPGSATYSIQFNVDAPNEVSFVAVSKGDTGAICFADGTRILTPEGERRVETLRVGDLVETLDHGAQAVRWIGASRVYGEGRLAPIEFAAGSIGNHADLRVSPEHRVLWSSPGAELLYGVPDVLIAAKHLVNGDSIRIGPQGWVTYYHLMFSQHEVIWAEGALTESFFVSDQSLQTLDNDTRAEFQALFPDLCAHPPTFGDLARRAVRQFEVHLVA